MVLKRTHTFEEKPIDFVAVFPLHFSNGNRRSTRKHSKKSTVLPSVLLQCRELQAAADLAGHSSSLADGSTLPTVPVSQAGHREPAPEQLVEEVGQRGHSLGQEAAVAEAVLEVEGVAGVGLHRHR